jgi:nucleotide-binding universal stress UspA family protein
LLPQLLEFPPRSATFLDIPNNRLVVRESDAGRKLEGASVMTKKILCATDGSDHSEAAVDLAANMAAKFGAKMAVIVVNIHISEGRGASHALWTEEQVDQILVSAKSKAKARASVEAETVKVSGREPTTVIVDYAAKNGFDHVVVGTPRKGVSRLVLGSVAAAVAAKAHCPVTVAR